VIKLYYHLSLSKSENIPMGEIPQLLDIPERKLVLAGRGLNAGEHVGRAILELTGSKKPQILVIPSPAFTKQDYEAYVADIVKTYGNLGVPSKHIDVLHEFGVDPSGVQIEDKLGAADALWITGGNTTQARETFARTGIGEAIRQSRNKVIAGGSAGALLQADGGLSWYTPDGDDVNSPRNRFVREKGLGLFLPSVNPHNNNTDKQTGMEHPRSHYLPDFMDKNPDMARPMIGIDHEAALVIGEGNYSIVSDPNHSASTLTVYAQSAQGGIESRQLNPNQPAQPLTTLVNPG
jgi:peptidase E